MGTIILMPIILMGAYHCSVSVSSISINNRDLEVSSIPPSCGSLLDGGRRVVIGPWSILGSMSPSQDLSRIEDVAWDSVPHRVTGYQEDSASLVPLYALTTGFCGEIFKPLLDLSAWAIRKGKLQHHRNGGDGYDDKDGWMDGLKDSNYNC
jgi:hypothetical protein